MTAIDEPSLMPVTKMNPYSISMISSVTRPPPNGAAAPNRSADSRLRPADMASSRPSADTIAASRTPGTRSAKLRIRKVMLAASELIGWVIVGPSLMAAIGVVTGGLVRGAGGLFPTALQSAAVPGEDVADLFRRPARRADPLGVPCGRGARRHRS